MSHKTVHQLTVESEAQLEQMLSECPTAIEDGLKVLERQVPAGRGFIDILAVDGDRTLVVVELKKDSDDRVLTQGLEYYDFVRDNLERFAQGYPDHEINVRVEPRLILVSGAFSPTIMAAARYVDVPLTLYTYVHLSVGDNKGLFVTEAETSPARDFKGRRLSVKEHLAYIKRPPATATCHAILSRRSSKNEDGSRLVRA